MDSNYWWMESNRQPRPSDRRQVDQSMQGSLVEQDNEPMEVYVPGPEDIIEPSDDPYGLRPAVGPQTVINNWFSRPDQLPSKLYLDENRAQNVKGVVAGLGAGLSTKYLGNYLGGPIAGGIGGIIGGILGSKMFGH